MKLTFGKEIGAISVLVGSEEYYYNGQYMVILLAYPLIKTSCPPLIIINMAGVGLLPTPSS